MKQAKRAKRAWYRYPYLWLVIAIPMTAVLSSSVLITFAYLYQDGLVVDDYYKHGKAINKVLIRDEFAATAGVKAIISFKANHTLNVSLQSTSVISQKAITLKLIHILNAEFDQNIRLIAVGPSKFIGKYRTFAPGNWYLQIENKQWRLLARKSINLNQDIILHMNSKTTQVKE